MRFYFLKMLGKISSNFGNFSLLGKVINVVFFSFRPKKIGQFKKLPALETFWHFGNYNSVQ